jgi:hypothetical protein
MELIAHYGPWALLVGGILFVAWCTARAICFSIEWLLDVEELNLWR